MKSRAGGNQDTGPLAKLLGGIHKPHRRSAFSVYQEKYFATRVSTEYKRRWENELKVYAEYTPQERLDQNIRKPTSVKTMTSTSAEFWQNELPAFKEQVQSEADACHKEAMASFNLGLSTPKTPMDYHK